MAEWADVYVRSYAERSALERRALFFVRDAAERLNGERVTQTDLIVKTHSLRKGRSDIAGRGAIENVFACKPVRYDSALGFVAVANAVLEDNQSNLRLSSRDIIACVFRLKDGPEVVKALGVSPAIIARATGIKEPIVEWATQRWRITYRHADALWRHLLQLKDATRIESSALAVLNSNCLDFIKTDARGDLPVAVKSLEAEAGHVEYVYQWEDLTAAPLSGHPWAIEGEDLAAPIPASRSRSQGRSGIRRLQPAPTLGPNSRT